MSALAYVFGALAAVSGILTCAMFRLSGQSDDAGIKLNCVVCAALTGIAIIATVRWL